MNKVEYTLKYSGVDSIEQQKGNDNSETNVDNRSSPRKSNVLQSMLQSPKKVHDPLLPAPWKAAIDPRGGGVYYYNKMTKQRGTDQ